MGGTDDPLAEKLTLSDGTVSLHRDAKFMHGTEEMCAGDHTIVQYVTGSEEDVVAAQSSLARIPCGFSFFRRLSHWGRLDAAPLSNIGFSVRYLKTCVQNR